MANICTAQQQIRIIPTWIVKAITKVLRKAIKCLGNSTCFLCWHAVYIGFHDFWPFNEHPLARSRKLFFVLTLLQINKKYLPKYFPINIQYKFGEKKHLRYFCQIFSELLFTVTDKTPQKKIQHISSLNLGFQA